MSSRRFLLRRVWHLAIPTPPAMGYFPTEYAEFTEPPAEMSSHGFLLRRVWHLAIPTPPAMGYSPTEYAEFTEPPTEMSSHGFHRFTQILRVHCSPTEFTEYTEFGSVGMAGMPYPPTSVLICAICGRLFSARSFCAFRAFCGNLFPPTDFTDLHRYLGCAFLPQNSQNSQNLAAWVWQGCHTLLHLCASVPSVGVLSLQEVLCIRCIPWELLHRLFGWCSRDSCTPWVGSVGMAGMPYPPTSVNIRAICGSPFSARGSVYLVHSVGVSSPLVRLVQLRQLHPLAESTEVVCKSHHLTISPPHHLSHLEPSLLHVLPVLWVRLRHHLRLVDAQPGEHDCSRCERHRHAVVVIRVDRL